MYPSLRKKLAEGKTKQVIEALIQLDHSDAELKNQVLQLASRFAEYKKQDRAQSKDSGELDLELNRIKTGLLELIDELESHPQSKSRRWWYGLVGLVSVLILYFGVRSLDFNSGVLKNVTVNVRSVDGDLIPALHTQAYVIMTTSGGGTPKELIDDKGAASFKNIKVGDQVRLTIDFSEPYKPVQPNSFYTVPEDGRIQLVVALQHLDKVFGRVMYGDQELPGVEVSIGDLRDTTNDLGRYEIIIPPDQQQKKQVVFFKKEGFQSASRGANPQTKQPVDHSMEKAQ